MAARPNSLTKQTRGTVHPPLYLCGAHCTMLGIYLCFFICLCNLLVQLTEYLEKNKFINYTHHGSVKGQVTQTLVQELFDNLMESMEEEEITAVIQTDQSKAYDVVNHQILLEKMRILGFNRKTLNILRSYLQNRRQFVVVDSYPSEPLAVGERSVTQGSALSGLLYIIMILDITSIYHEKTHTPVEANQCQKYTKDPDYRSNFQNSNAKTFVDDNIIHTKATQDKTIQQAVMDTITTLEGYMNANLLALNPEKSRVMLLTKNKQIKENFKIKVAGKVLTHQPSLMILGNRITADLTWEEHVNKIVIPSLANRVRTLRNITSFMNQDFRRNYGSAIFRGKLVFAADAWGGVSKTTLKRVQKLQDQAAKVILGFPYRKKSNSQRLKILGWPNVEDKITIATMRLTQKVLHKILQKNWHSKCRKINETLK